MTTESTQMPVKVLGLDRMLREEPCLFRLNGLAVWRNVVTQEAAAESGWPSPYSFNLTHEASGMLVASLPTLELTRVGAAILTRQIGVNWGGSIEEVLKQVKANPVAGAVIQAVAAGRLVEAGPDMRPLTPNQRGGMA